MQEKLSSSCQPFTDTSKAFVLPHVGARLRELAKVRLHHLLCQQLQQCRHMLQAVQRSLVPPSLKPHDQLLQDPESRQGEGSWARFSLRSMHSMACQLGRLPLAKVLLLN